MNEQLKRHAPTAAIAAVTIAAVASLTSRAPSSTPGAPSSTPATKPAIAPSIGAAATPPIVAQALEPDITTRIVSCGPSAKVDGNDTRGTVNVDLTIYPAEPTRKCTVLFAISSTPKICTVTGGTIDKLTKSDLVVSGISQAFTYECR